MADLSIGEVGKVLQLSLINIDTTQNPPVSAPLDLSGASKVELSWVITDQRNVPQSTLTTVMMAITNSLGGIVQYAFLANDLVRPPTMGKTGMFRFSVKVTFVSGTILISAEDGRLTIKDDSVL